MAYEVVRQKLGRLDQLEPEVWRLRSEAAWVEAVFAGQTRAYFLSELALLHNVGHLYDKRAVLSLAGHPAPR